MRTHQRLSMLVRHHRRDHGNPGHGQRGRPPDDPIGCAHRAPPPASVNSLVSARLIMYVRCESGLGHMGFKSLGTQAPRSGEGLRVRRRLRASISRSQPPGPSEGRSGREGLPESAAGDAAAAGAFPRPPLTAGQPRWRRTGPERLVWLASAFWQQGRRSLTSQATHDE
jgi:hypothetical protein